ncbi:MAG: biotin--[acetyl-CoA-carboxylase] ligase [Anaerolineales bacterium]|nr:biotin--[acetyl-CoA-carboxylase] ligase [Anaerolineales bacterium]
MRERHLKAALRDLPLGGFRYFDRTGSTNDVALAWAAEGAPDLSLVVADEQTAGRGRSRRHWYTPPGSALAFSLVLRPRADEAGSLSRFSGLAALAVCAALAEYDLPALIKWPNDILLGGRKVCGILVEAVWLGEQVDSLVVGVGVNVGPESVPAAELLNFPATCLETEAARTLDRGALLGAILAGLLAWRERMPEAEFLSTWVARLAFRGEQVEVWTVGQAPRRGTLAGLDPDGSLRLRSPEGAVCTVHFGEVHLRPVV